MNRRRDAHPPRLRLVQPLALTILVFLAAGRVASPAPASDAVERGDHAPAYRAVLARLAAGDPEGALADLTQLELRVLGERASPRAVERFWRLKLGVVRDLLAAGPVDLLVPVAVFHHQAYQTYRAEARSGLAAHARTMAAELAEFYARRAGTPESREFAGWVLTSFGSYLQENRSIPLSVLMFRRALEVAPGNPVAILGVAAAHEKYGEYEPAKDTLKRALQVDPENAQARLRLAVCLRRMGQEATARAQLRYLTDGGADDWIRSVAYQELARMDLDAGDREAAERRLREALAELPGEQEPAVLLAAVLELEGRHREARRLVAEIGPSASDRPSARFLYDSWTRQGVDDARHRLVRMMQDRLDLLGEALARTPEAEVPPAAEEAG